MFADWRNCGWMRAIGALVAVSCWTGCGAQPRPAPSPVADGEVAAAAASEAPAIEADAPTYAYRCRDGYEFVARVGGDSARVVTSSGTASLRREVSASGVKYSDGSTTLWTKGQEALLEEVGAIHRECFNDPQRAVWEGARLRGVDFRALGNEPPWLLEIAGGSTISLVTEYGAKRYEFALPAAEQDAETGATLYRTQGSGHELAVALRPRPCHDTMSGEQFTTQVTITIDGRTLHGCGRAMH